MEADKRYEKNHKRNLWFNSEYSERYICRSSNVPMSPENIKRVSNLILACPNVKKAHVNTFDDFQSVGFWLHFGSLRVNIVYFYHYDSNKENFIGVAYQYDYIGNYSY